MKNTTNQFRTFQDVSREGFGPLPVGRKLKRDDIMVGALLRIADALEHIARNLPEKEQPIKRKKK